MCKQLNRKAPQLLGSASKRLDSTTDLVDLLNSFTISMHSQAYGTVFIVGCPKTLTHLQPTLYDQNIRPKQTTYVVLRHFSELNELPDAQPGTVNEQPQEVLSTI